MSQIGWYVHWRKANYIRMGTSLTPGKSQGKSPGTLAAYFKNARNLIINNAKNNFTSGLNGNDLHELEMFYTSVFFPKDNLNDAEQKLIEKFQKGWKEVFEKFRNGNLILNGNGGIVQEGSYVGGKFADKDVFDSSDVNEILKLLDNVKHRSGYNKSEEHRASDLALAEKVRAKVGRKKGAGLEDQDLIREIKDRFINRSFLTLYGSAFEDGLAVANTILKDIEGQVDEVVYRAMVVGKETSAATISSSSIPDFIGSKRKKDIIAKSQKKKQNLDKDFDYDVHRTQNKVDIRFNYKGKLLNMSAKYVGKNNDMISIHSGSSLLKILQQSKGDISPDWFNHYLNIAVEPADTLYRNYANARKEALKTFDVLMAVKGLTGNILGKQGQANVFTVYDAANKRVRIIDMSLAIRKLESLVQKGGIKIENIGNIDLIPVNEIWTENSVLSRTEARNRIADIISYLDQQKYKISLDKKQLL